MSRWKLPFGHTYTFDYRLQFGVDKRLQYFIASELAVELTCWRMETDRMQSIVNESLTRLFFGSVSLVAKLTRADLVKYSKLYDESMGAANRMATSILSLEVIQCLQAHEAQWKVVEKHRQRQRMNSLIISVPHTFSRRCFVWCNMDSTVWKMLYY
eukprot:scaffold966_cov179-Skeletonema_dohrnii-CCMP3373.AAC.1